MFILKKGHQPGVYVPLRALFLVFGQGVVFYFIMQLLEKISPTSFTLKRGAPPTAILFILTTGTGISLQTESSISPL